MKISVQIRGLDQVLAQMQARQAAVRAAVNRVIAKYALLIEGDAKRLAPVDTGRLRASIHHVLSDLAAQVIAATDYASFQEFGTSKMAAQPYMRPALEKHRAGFVAALREAVAEAAGGS